MYIISAPQQPWANILAFGSKSIPSRGSNGGKRSSVGHNGPYLGHSRIKETLDCLSKERIGRWESGRKRGMIVIYQIFQSHKEV